ncbi:hypothetical protein ACXWHK_004623 [Vibrio alginolyticus]|uniref:hypothetical protein n=1 Tax=unclassified Vibrio TaxID=2614977 RepID=UPI0021D00BB0|nr:MULTISPECIES: hypothetical protein [unclassified Vibrio]MDW1675065.1 hypothetical protein [Vibrio sp. Vb2610]MDW1807290.1 hypothetical protein [Vibrio sp. Vb2628]
MTLHKVKGSGTLMFATALFTIAVIGWLNTAEQTKENHFEQKTIKLSVGHLVDLDCDESTLTEAGYDLPQFANVSSAALNRCREEVGKKDLEITFGALKNVYLHPSLAVLDMVISEAQKSTENPSHSCIEHVVTLTKMCPDLLLYRFRELESALNEIDSYDNQIK